MAVGYETNIQTPEIEQQPELLVWKHDYEGRKVRGHDTWYETSLFDNGDGSRTVYSNVIPLSEAPLGGQNTWVDESGRSNDELVHDTLRAVANIQKTPVGDALRTLGIAANYHDDYTRDAGTVEATYLKPEALIERLDVIRKTTGWAPHIKTFRGDDFTALDQTEALEAAGVLVSDNPLFEQHDVTGHGVVWLLLPESTFTRIATRSREAYDAKHDKTATPVEQMDNSYAFKNHFGTLETDISHATLYWIAQGLDGDERSLETLSFKLGEVMYTQQGRALSEEQKAVCATEARALVDRVAQLAALAT